MILIISFEDNTHVEAVRRHLTMDHEVVDLAWFPARMRLTATTGPDGHGAHLTLPSGRQIAVEDVGAVWNRRIRPYTLHDDLQDETARLFAWSESTEALEGVWHASDAWWMNPWGLDEAVQRKVWQLAVAREVGLAVPRTCVTNDPDEARAFVDSERPNPVIRKAFRNIEQAPRTTAIVDDEAMRAIDSVRYAPVIFQEYVPVAVDLRVTVVDGEVLAAAIRSEATHAVDYRPGLDTAHVTAWDLPDDVTTALLALMDRFGLRYGAIDLRVTPEGRHVFLEVNPAGEFLFVSQRLDLPIPQVIAAALERHARDR